MQGSGREPRDCDWTCATKRSAAVQVVESAKSIANNRDHRRRFFLLFFLLDALPDPFAADDGLVSSRFRFALLPCPLAFPFPFPFFLLLDDAGVLGVGVAGGGSVAAGLGGAMSTICPLHDIQQFCPASYHCFLIHSRSVFILGA